MNFTFILEELEQMPIRNSNGSNSNGNTLLILYEHLFHEKMIKRRQNNAGRCSRITFFERLNKYFLHPSLTDVFTL